MFKLADEMSKLADEMSKLANEISKLAENGLMVGNGKNQHKNVKTCLENGFFCPIDYFLYCLYLLKTFS